MSGFPTGKSHLKKDHPYIADLDVFGSHSLFQLLDRTTTESGGLCLANWLSEAASKETILERQQAIKELNPKLQWRQQFQAAGMPFSNKSSDYQKLLHWFETSEKLLPKQSKYLVGSITLTISSSVLFALILIGSLSGDWILYLTPFLVVLFTNMMVLSKVAPLAEEIIDYTDRNVKILGGYQLLMDSILAEKFSEKRLKDLQADLNSKEYSSSKEIKKLRKLLEMFQLRGTKRSDSNKFYTIFNLLWLFDIYLIILIER